MRSGDRIAVMSGSVARTEVCFICRKHDGRERQPPGGYIFEGRHFLLCHAPLNLGTSGTLIVESKRHLLDYSEMAGVEAAELFEMLRKLFPLMKKSANAERIYSLAMMDGAPHFHLAYSEEKRLTLSGSKISLNKKRLVVERC